MFLFELNVWPSSPRSLLWPVPLPSDTGPPRLTVGHRYFYPLRARCYRSAQTPWAQRQVTRVKKDLAEALEQCGGTGCFFRWSLSLWDDAPISSMTAVVSSSWNKCQTYFKKCPFALQLLHQTVHWFLFAANQSHGCLSTNFTSRINVVSRCPTVAQELPAMESAATSLDRQPPNGALGSEILQKDKESELRKWWFSLRDWDGSPEAGAGRPATGATRVPPLQLVRPSRISSF
jgi:hypothetical protein